MTSQTTESDIIDIISRSFNIPAHVISARHDKHMKNRAKFLDDVAHKYCQSLKIQAARRAIDIINQMKPGPYKAKHQSRVFGNLNRLRVS